MSGERFDDLSIAALVAALRAGRTTAVAVTEQCLARLRARDAELGAFVTVTDDAARAAARATDEALAGGTAGALAGVPVAVKDLLAVRGVVRSNGSAAFARDAAATVDATVVARLRAAGAIIIGTTQMHELAFGPTGVNPSLGTPRNPWAPGHVPGGSSSGSGAAVAAGLVAAALGTDTAGSIRIPASFCGISGLKPTYGRVSRAGAAPLAWTLDHIGPMARRVEDLVPVLQAIAGHDRADPTSARVPVPDYTAALARPLPGLRIGVPRHFALAIVAPEVGAAFEQALADLQRGGAVVRDVELPSLAHTGPAVGATVLAEAGLSLPALLGERAAEVGLEIRIYLGLSKVVTAAHYLAAQRLRSVLYEEARGAFAEVDVLATPATILPAPRIEDLQVRLGETDVGVVEAIPRLTGPFNLIGLPALALPCGCTRAGLPIGLQLVARPFAEATLFAAGHAYQQRTTWHERRPQ